MVSGVSKSQFLFFCEMGKNGENVATNTIDFGEQTEFYVINTKNENVTLGGKCTKTTKITGIPRFENHQTNFVIDLENDQIIVKNVQVISKLLIICQELI